VVLNPGVADHTWYKPLQDKYMDKDTIQDSLPLTPKVFHVMMALAGEPMNGYRLGIAVEETTQGTIRLSPGSLYENIHRLKARGLIDELDGEFGNRRDGRGQRFYALTDLGLAVLKAEVARLARDVSMAQSIARLT